MSAAIPRPPGARPGPAAPWAVAQRGRALDAAAVRAAFPGQPEADEVPLAAGKRPAAVLVALFEEDGRARVVLTRRSGRLRSHTGQVSFPGGLVDEGEASQHAALREAAEEVGIDPASVEILGVLSPLTTLSSQAQLTPFVGLLAGRPQLVPNPAEVDRVFDVALEDLVAEGVYRQEIWEVAGASRPVHFFELDGETVWGATAQVLFELLVLVSLAAGWRYGELS